MKYLLYGYGVGGLAKGLILKCYRDNWATLQIFLTDVICLTLSILLFLDISYSDVHHR